MVKANDLRIGNYFYPDVLGAKDGDFEVVTAEHISDLYSDPQDDYYQPILLTEGWLGRLGFLYKETKIRYGNGYDYQPKDVFTTTKIYKLNDNIKYHLEDWNCKGEIENQDSFMFYDSSLVKCRYVHQLQNLYFALTGEELEIK